MGTITTLRFSDPGLWNHFISGCSTALTVICVNECDTAPALGKLLNGLIDYLGKTEGTPERDALLTTARERFGSLWM